MVFAVFASVSIFQLSKFETKTKTSAQFIQEQFKNFKSQTLALKPGEAQESLTNIKEEIQNLKKPAAYELLENAISKLKNASAVFRDFALLTGALDSFSSEAEYLQENAFHLITNQQGKELLESLQKLSASIDDSTGLFTNIKNEALTFGYKFDREASALNSELSLAKQTLDALINWLNQPEPRNIIILFQNPSEIRPAGGFAGSYAEIALEQASLTKIKVQDIYYPDRFLPLRIIPPKPLQLITANWGARDAAWFFDFPTSAAKTLKLLEESRIYKERGENFAALLAINVDVIESLLDITGPIELREYGATINKNNFLSEIQREVETGGDKKAGDPKRILKVLTPIFLGKISALDENQKQRVIEKIKRHLANKDIAVFFKDPILESYAKNHGISGEVFQQDKNFVGDYLAVVNANIGGGKSDEFVEQTIELRSKIGENGTIFNHLVIERSHRGQDQPDWWYRSVNKNYIQILAPLNASLLDIKGNTSRKIKPPINYGERGYDRDLDLRAIESAAQVFKESVEESIQFGKKSFAAWFDVKGGESKKLEIQYQNENAVKLSGRTRYQFVFDKQAGVNGELRLFIEAPPGYKWAENQQSVYEYETDNIPARIILDLTLIDQKL